MLALLLLLPLHAGGPGGGKVIPTAGGPGGGKVFLTTEEALQLAFPEARMERTTHYLTRKQLEAARERAAVEIGSAIVQGYRAWDRDGRLLGTAYFDTHRVRTLPETLMVVVDPAGRVRRVEVLSFDEPLDYLPKGAWYAQFQGRALDQELALRRGIQGVTGASLTARATTDAVRRILALHAVVEAGAGAAAAARRGEDGERGNGGKHGDAGGA